MILTDRELVWCTRLAENRELSHVGREWNGYNIDAHYLGALGEYFFAKDNNIDLNLISDIGTDPGFDFKFQVNSCKTLRVDIKTKSWDGAPPLKWFIKENKVFSDLYLFVRFVRPRFVIPMGWLWSGDVLRCPVDNPRGTPSHVVTSEDGLMSYEFGLRALPKLTR